MQLAEKAFSVVCVEPCIPVTHYISMKPTYTSHERCIRLTNNAHIWIYRYVYVYMFIY